jgi:hypothetical protein
VCDYVHVPIDDGAAVRAPDADDQHGRPRLLVWQDELNASVGYQALALMHYIRRIGYVFQGNAAQYTTLVARMQNPEFSLPILDISNRQAHDDLLSEVERLLHNVLMALSTRIDQQRVFMKKHFSQDAALMSEYLAKVKGDFGSYAPSVFLRDLRNYMTHHRLPVAQSRQTISMQSFSVTFILLRRSLCEWPKWTSEAKKWIAGQGDEIDIACMIDEYARIAGGFDSWLHDRIGFKYASEISVYEEAAIAFNREWDRAFGS